MELFTICYWFLPIQSNLTTTHDSILNYTTGATYVNLSDFG